MPTSQEKLDQYKVIIDRGMDEYVSADIRRALTDAHQIVKDDVDNLLTDDQKSIIADWVIENDDSVTTNRTYNFPSGSIRIGDSVLESGARILNFKSDSVGVMSSVLKQTYDGGKYYKALVVDDTETSVTVDVQVANDTDTAVAAELDINYVAQGNIHIQKVNFKPFGGTVTQDFIVELRFDIIERTVYKEAIDYTTLVDLGGGLFQFSLSHPALFDISDIIHIKFSGIQLLGGNNYDGTDGIRQGDINYTYFFPYLEFEAIPIVYQNIATEDYVDAKGHYLGVFADITALTTAYPTAFMGDTATVTSPDGNIFYWNGAAWTDSGTGYLGDMLKSIYDPTNVAGDTFDMANMVEGTTNKIFTDSERTKLTGIEPLAEVNNISDVDATDLTDAGDSTLHYHATDRDRANHTGTQVAATISDFDTEVSNNVDVTANTAKVSADGSVTTHSDVTSAGSGEIITSAERTDVVENKAARTLLTEPNGTVDADTDISISFVDGTRTFTVEPTGTEYNYYSDGLRYNKTAAENIVIDNTEGFVFIYYDGATLSKTNTWSNDIVTKKCYLAAIYWDAVNGKQIYFGREYKHTAQMDGKTHSYLHNTIGFALADGGSLGDFTIDGTGDLDADAQFSNEASVCYDEDARFDHSARLKTANIPVYYRTGATASNIWRVDETTSFPVITTGTGRAAYNEFTGGNWQLTEIPNNDFALAHIVLTNDTDRPYVAVMGQATYSIIANARDAALTELLNLIRDGLFGEEFKFVATVIVQTNDSYTNAVKSRLRSTEDGGNYVDWREVSLTRGAVGGIYDHNALAGLQGGIATEYYHLTSAELTKLGGIEAGAQVNPATYDAADIVIDDTSFTGFLSGVTDAQVMATALDVALDPATLSVVRTTNLTIPAADTVIIADTELIEDNLSYDNTTGVLTVTNDGTYMFSGQFRVVTTGVNKLIEIWLEYESAPTVWSTIPYAGIQRNYATQDEVEINVQNVRAITAGTKLRLVARSNDATAVVLTTATLNNSVVMPSVRLTGCRLY